MRRCAVVALSAVLSFGCISQEEQQPDDRLVGTKWEARDYPYEEKTGVAPAYNIYEFICPRQVEQYVVQDGHVVEAIGTYAYELAYPRLTIHKETYDVEFEFRNTRSMVRLERAAEDAYHEYLRQ